MPKISVIIPVYNVEEYLRECLDSIVNQTLKDIEIICVNDGSPDNSLGILNEYASQDNRFVIINQQNQGLSASRNNGLDVAKGDYVAFIDSDDYLLNNDYFEKLLEACEKYNADIAVAGIIRGNKRRTSTILEVKKTHVTTNYKEKLRICDVPNSNYVWNKLYKRENLINSGIKFPVGRLYEDIYVTYKYLYYSGNLVSVPDVYYFYRSRKGSIIKNGNSKASEDCKAGKIEMNQFFKEHGIDVSDMETITKKYKLLGLTLFKVIKCGKHSKYVLFNFIKWVNKEQG